jgi:uncharacterized membrane protein YoaK (UPF0700 family)
VHLSALLLISIYRQKRGGIARVFEDRRDISRFSMGLAFVGGYSDAASFILANTFTGHVTGNLVLTAISTASLDYPNFSRRVLAIAMFLTGVILSVILERRLAPRLSRSFLPVVLCTEIVLILLSCFVLTSHLAFRLGFFVICTALALGLQNGAWRKAGGITVHSTYITGMITSLLAAETQRYISNEPPKEDAGSEIGTLTGIWVAFVAGALLGAAMVLGFGAPGILGAALVLLALLICQFGAERRS